MGHGCSSLRRLESLFGTTLEALHADHVQGLVSASAHEAFDLDFKAAGVDGETACYVEDVRGVPVFLADLRADLKSGRFTPLPARERMIPKPGGKLRRLGIPTVRDRVVQAALKLILEPIFEADFRPCSYGFRPGRRAQDAIAGIHRLRQSPAQLRVGAGR